MITGNWSRSGAVGVRQLLKELLAAGRPVYVLDTETFANRGIWWLGARVEALPHPTEGVNLFRVIEQVPGMPVPLRQFIPPGRD